MRATKIATLLAASLLVLGLAQPASLAGTTPVPTPFNVVTLGASEELDLFLAKLAPATTTVALPGTPLSAEMDLLVVENAWYFELPAPIKDRVTRTMQETLQSGVPVLLVGPGHDHGDHDHNDDIASIPHGIGMSYTRPIDGFSELVVMMVDPTTTITTESGTLLPRMRSLDVEINYDERADLSTQGAVDVLVPWLSAGFSEMDLGDCPPTAACPANHQDAGAQGFVQFHDNTYSSNTEFQPYGKLNRVIKVYYLRGDAYSGADYFDIVSNHETVPGKVAWGNDWRNAWVNTGHDLDYYDSANYMIDWGPNSAGGETSSVSFNLEVSENGLAVGLSISYTKPDITITAQSDTGLDLQRSVHDFDYKSNVATSTGTWMGKPGATQKDTNLGGGSFYHDYRNAWVDPNWCGWACGWDTYNSPTKAFQTTWGHTSY